MICFDPTHDLDKIVERLRTGANLVDQSRFVARRRYQEPIICGVSPKAEVTHSYSKRRKIVLALTVWRIGKTTRRTPRSGKSTQVLPRGRRWAATTIVSTYALLNESYGRLANTNGLNERVNSALIFRDDGVETHPDGTIYAKAPPSTASSTARSINMMNESSELANDSYRRRNTSAVSPGKSAP